MIKKRLLFLLIMSLTLSFIIGCRTPIQPEVKPETQGDTPTVIEEDVAEKCLLVIDEWSPYTGKNLSQYGIATEIVTAALQAAEIPYEVKFVPWGRALEMVKHNDAWATFPWFNTDTRDQDFYFSEPILQVKSTIFYNVKNPKFSSGPPSFKTLEDLKIYTFGGVNGYYYESIFEENGYDYALSQSLKASFKLLIDGKVDLINEDEIVGHYILDQHYTDFKTLIMNTSTYLSTEPMYLLVGKDENQSKWLESFNKGLQTIKDNGTYDSILNTLKTP